MAIARKSIQAVVITLVIFVLAYWAAECRAGIFNGPLDLGQTWDVWLIALVGAAFAWFGVTGSIRTGGRKKK